MNAKFMLLCLAIAIVIMAFGLTEVESMREIHTGGGGSGSVVDNGRFHQKGNFLSSAGGDDFEVVPKSPGRREFLFNFGVNVK
jgi:hypothetical protein